MSTPQDRAQDRRNKITAADLGRNLMLDEKGRIDVRLSKKSALGNAADGLTVNFDEETLKLKTGSPWALGLREEVIAPVQPTLSAFVPPTAHATSHENGGADEIDVTGLSGLLADPQTPLAHTHALSDVTGARGELVIDSLAGTPLIFGDIVQDPVTNDLVYA